MTKIVILCIELYQKTLSPDHGVLKVLFPFGVCRYNPTCSEYALAGVRKFGLVKGLFLGMKRVVRCHPFAKGGNDPLPLLNK